MNLTDLYQPLKCSHLILVTISIMLFVARAGGTLAGARWLNRRWLKVAPHIIDSFLLLSGIGLMVSIAQYPISHHWLSMKMLLLVGYIGFGMKAMKSSQPMQQRSYFAAALCCVLLMVTVASTHHPLGLFSLLF